MGLLSKLAVKAAKSAAKKAPKAVEKPRSPLAVKPPLALPAPPKPLALPAPGPGLPPLASKPRGGQWWVDKPSLDYGNSSPEEAARQGALSLALTRWVPDDDYGVVGRDAEGRLRDALLGGQTQTVETDAQKWLERALTKYYKNDFGSPEDPLRDLAARGLHYDPDMTPEKWQATVNSYLMEDPIQQIMFPPNPAGGMPGAGSNLRGETMAAMPWLAKVPATDKVYGISGGGLDLSHFTDEFLNALNDPEASGLPLDLAVRPESLGRMTFPQAVEHVGKINQYRVKQMERAALDAQDNPVTHIFKEYAENNPKGLRWVEMAPPKGDGPTNYDIEEELSKALKYEGDTMGHCVGGYCPDVMEGRSRIFSLRDAKGEPHVTIETQPPNKDWAPVLHLRELGVFPDWQKYIVENPGLNATDPAVLEEFLRTRNLPPVNYDVEDIIQIKGKQNRKPKDEYLPFVRDFVKSGNWGRIGDEENSGLRRFRGELIPSEDYDAMLKDAYDWMRASPGGKAVREFYKTEMDGYGSPTYKEADNFINSTTVPVGNSLYSLNEVLNVLEDPGAWEPEIIESVLEGVDYLKNNPIEVPPIFKGFAVGGRVDPDRCFCRHPMAVKR